MKRYKKFVLEAEKGITFEVLEGTDLDEADLFPNDENGNEDRESYLEYLDSH